MDLCPDVGEEAKLRPATAQKKGEDVEYVIPPDTLRIDITIAKTKEAPEQALLVGLRLVERRA